jgi:hypothetical protein
MQVAYYDLGSLRIKDFPSEETRIPLRPTNSQREAARILAEVTKKYPDTHWKIVGDGPWGVHEKRR